ncbi:MAG: hypothetical protein R3C17_00710 [Planctomycetaceae bacterium]
MMSGWLVPETEPDKEVVDWDMYLGPAAWRPFNAKLLDGFNFEKGEDSWVAVSLNGARTVWIFVNGPSVTARLPLNTTHRRTANW